ncbi:MAG: AAA family ATPase [Anaerolineales bacterium]|nr:AAA family ATPase [Anaerolineales bacterium]
MGRVLVVANQKGGVGKTTTVINLGAALAERGSRVLLIDLDPQAGLSASLGFDPYKVNPTTHTLLMDEKVSLDRIVCPFGERLWVAPANIDLAAAEYGLPRVDDSAGRLRRALDGKREHVDFVLIDTPPSLGILTVNGLVAADELVIPVECQYLAMRGIRALLETAWLLQKRIHHDVHLLGILATMYRPDSLHASEVVNELRAVFGDKVFQTVIEMDESVMIAPAARKSVLSFKPDSPAAIAYRSLAEEVLRSDS